MKCLCKNYIYKSIYDSLVVKEKVKKHYKSRAVSVLPTKNTLLQAFSEGYEKI